MKKVLASVAIAGMITGVSAADFGTTDAQFMFGQESVNVVTMSGAEMAQTEGQLLEALGALGAIPIAGPILTDLLASLNLGALLGLVPAALDAAFPISADLGINVGGLLSIDTGRDPLTIDSGLPALVGAVVSSL
ncbi:hypothetical protein LOH54_02385 [Sulfurimonas sp. HSL-3221]|uniref:hypothetical protein n=1 Tax=Sulfurimonadaceae TaxID=2771471 RepID=UPI001E3B3DED|nr:hypothetical protein [Sulfurimonas sp. HSL-3221]UFS62982.1 hypothetical protein LOH54_02385 [Sulfurimonas sp. HSL-3221]